jgi:hypothetical protein
MSKHHRTRVRTNPPIVAHTPAINAGTGCTAILPVGSAHCVIVEPDPDAATDLELAVGDAVFSNRGFRLFMGSALQEMDAMFRRGIAERREARRMRQETTARRSHRNQRAAAATVYSLTEQSAADVVRAMLARAMHASDATAETGLIPVIIS